jgi:hypothetical protein
LDYPYDHTLLRLVITPVVADDAALAYYNEEAKDDIDGIVATVFYDWRMATKEGREF